MDGSVSFSIGFLLLFTEVEAKSGFAGTTFRTSVLNPRKDLVDKITVSLHMTSYDDINQTAKVHYLGKDRRVQINVTVSGLEVSEFTLPNTTFLSSNVTNSGIFVESTEDMLVYVKTTGLKFNKPSLFPVPPLCALGNTYTLPIVGEGRYGIHFLPDKCTSSQVEISDLVQGNKLRTIQFQTSLQTDFQAVQGIAGGSTVNFKSTCASFALTWKLSGTNGYYQPSPDTDQKGKMFLTIPLKDWKQNGKLLITVFDQNTSVNISGRTFNIELKESVSFVHELTSANLSDLIIIHSDKGILVTQYWLNDGKGDVAVPLIPVGRYTSDVKFIVPETSTDSTLFIAAGTTEIDRIQVDGRKPQSTESFSLRKQSMLAFLTSAGSRVHVTGQDSAVFAVYIATIIKLKDATSTLDTVIQAGLTPASSCHQNTSTTEAQDEGKLASTSAHVESITKAPEAGDTGNRSISGLSSEKSTKAAKVPKTTPTNKDTPESSSTSPAVVSPQKTTQTDGGEQNPDQTTTTDGIKEERKSTMKGDINSSTRNTADDGSKSTVTSQDGSTKRREDTIHNSETRTNTQRVENSNPSTLGGTKVASSVETGSTSSSSVVEGTHTAFHESGSATARSTISVAEKPVAKNKSPWQNTLFYVMGATAAIPTSVIIVCAVMACVKSIRSKMKVNSFGK